MKRIIRESYRLSQDSVKTGYDIIFVARASEKKANRSNHKMKAVYVPSYEEIEKDMRRLSSVLGMLT